MRPHFCDPCERQFGTVQLLMTEIDDSNGIMPSSVFKEIVTSWSSVQGSLHAVEDEKLGSVRNF
jgi:hypothetical protein